MFLLGTSDKYLTVSEWNGVTRVHIRSYFHNDSGELLPTKKGVALTIDEWKALKSYVDSVDAQIDLLKDEEKPFGQLQQQKVSSLIPEKEAEQGNSQKISSLISKIRRVAPYQQLYE